MDHTTWSSAPSCACSFKVHSSHLPATCLQKAARGGRPVGGAPASPPPPAAGTAAPRAPGRCAAQSHSRRRARKVNSGTHSMSTVRMWLYPWIIPNLARGAGQIGKMRARCARNWKWNHTRTYESQGNRETTPEQLQVGGGRAVAADGGQRGPRRRRQQPQRRAAGRLGVPQLRQQAQRQQQHAPRVAWKQEVAPRQRGVHVVQRRSQHPCTPAWPPQQGGRTRSINRRRLVINSSMQMHPRATNLQASNHE